MRRLIIPKNCGMDHDYWQGCALCIRSLSAIFANRTDVNNDLYLGYFYGIKTTAKDINIMLIKFKYL
ncbi:7402_t:CDS:2 [Rhizophagus irregularis]|nr:7402_t:CDS:2 [Rhizophagus irregularis]